MHVMHVIDHLGPGGAERMLVDIANNTSEHEVSVCVTRADLTLAKELRPGIELFVLERKSRFDPKGLARFAWYARKSRFDPKGSARFAWYPRESRFDPKGSARFAWYPRESRFDPKGSARFAWYPRRVDLFHVHGRTTLSFVLFARALGLVSAPMILHDHYNVELDTVVPAWFRLWGSSHLGAYVGVYDHLVSWAQNAGVAPEKTFLVENALDLSRFARAGRCDLRAELGIPKDLLVGVVIGHICRDKGIDTLIDALARSKLAHTAKFVLVGEPRDPEFATACRRECEAKGLSDRVLFVGRRPETISVLRSADFALLASRAESGPVALLEYMACGLPLVATPVGAIGARAQALGVTELVPPDDAGAFAEALDRLLALSPAERQERGLRNQELAQSFDIRQTMPRWYELYASVTSDLL